MSLSQKHSGKVLVPFFNRSEWRLVFDLIYSETSQNLQRALEILRIWKHRTPLLSAGIEGTLIILEALLVNVTTLTEYEKSHIYSTSLVRFLNLCAGGGDKQGTFYKSAMKNGIPKWLISLRHEIAHSHNVPSLSMLEISLKFCLSWLKEKYWDVQEGNMVDYIVQKSSNSIVEDATFVYMNWNERSEVMGQNYKVVRRIKRLLKVPLEHVSSKKIMKKIDLLLGEEIRRNRKESLEKIGKIFIDRLRLEANTADTDTNKVPTNALNKWNNLINIIYDENLLLQFVIKLFEFSNHESNDLNSRENASLWIKEIFQSLIAKQNSEAHSGLSFKTHNFSMKDKSFALRAVQEPNVFTLHYIEQVLAYNDSPSDFIEDSLSLLKAFNVSAGFNEGRVYSIRDLNIEDSSDSYLCNLNGQESMSRWMPIAETAPYMNLPLGILPHQDKNRNPLLSA